MNLMHQIVIKHLTERFASFADLADQISDADLHKDLDVPGSKNLANHMWCIIGARESYSSALKAGAWAGFTSSLTDFTRAGVKDKLASSAAAFDDAVAAIDDWTGEREELLASLMEHEAMHEGQIIRLFHGLEIALPESVKWD